jgi:hypothetical protein
MLFVSQIQNSLTSILHDGSWQNCPQARHREASLDKLGTP